MPNYDEHELNSLKDKNEEISIPNNIDQYIRAGIRKGKKHKVGVRRRALLSIAASFIIFTLVISIRVSPVFASYVSKIPGFDVIVNLINYDKGLQLAVENDFIQPIGESDEHEGLKITVDHIIIDESRMVMFYTIENNADHQFIELYKTKFLDQNGKQLAAGVTYEGFGNKDMREYKKLNGKIDVMFNFIDGQEIPDTIYFEANISESPANQLQGKPIRVGEEPKKKPVHQLASTWKIKIPIDKTKFKGLKETYTLNKTVNVEGQNIEFQELTIYPTRIALKIKYDEDNSKKIFSFDDLRVVDENGEEFASIVNGVSGSKLDENTEILYLQSNYFKKPKELYIKASRLKALNKDKAEVSIDLGEKSIVSMHDELLTLEKVTKINNEIKLEFTLKKMNPIDIGHSYFPFYSIFHDNDGKEYHSIRSGTYSNAEENIDTLYYRIDNIEYSNPIKLIISQYPTRIYGDINLKVK